MAEEVSGPGGPEGYGGGQGGGKRSMGHVNKESKACSAQG